MTDREIVANFIRAGETEEHRLGLELEHFILNEMEEGIEFEVLSELIRETGNTFQESRVDDGQAFL